MPCELRAVFGGEFPDGLPPQLLVPKGDVRVLRSRQSPVRIWLVKYVRLHLHLQA